jgi:predicted Zn-dependent peptidase
VAAARGLAVLLALAVAPVAVPAQVGEPAGPRPPGLDLPVVEETLPNGLRVLALARPGAPTVSFVLRFDVGSVNEVLGETGIAHFLEHLLFKGTTTIGTTSLAREQALFRVMDAAHDSILAHRAGRLPGNGHEERLRERIRELEDSARGLVVPNEWDRILGEAGARDMNASTSLEATTYWARLPSNRAELWFVLEADRMAHPIFREFYAERDVVAEERRQRVETSPGGRLMEEFYATAYRVHPYGVPVIGHMSDIQAYTRERVADYHRRFYRPNNAVMAVVGDIDPDQVLRWVRRYFGPIPAGDAPPPVLASEPPQRGERRIEVVFEAEPEIIIGWHVPAAQDPRAPAVELLAQVLAGGRTSRLYRRLVVDDNLAGGISVGLGPGLRYPQMLTISAQPLHGRSTAELEAAIYDEIEGILRDPPTEFEMQRVRNQLEASDIHRLASPMGLALQLAESVAYHGDWRETFRQGQRLAGVTPADVQAVVRQFLTRDNRTVAVRVRPENARPRAAEPGDPEETGP